MMIMAIDQFQGNIPGLHSPAIKIESVTPSDTVDLVAVTRAINVAVSGVVKLITADGTTGDIYVAAGVAFPIRASRILATGTTASGIRGLS
jgi:hypothetical protein